MRVGQAADLEDVLRALGQFLVDADVFLEHGSRIQLGLVVVAHLDVTACCERSDDLRGDGIDLAWIQSHSRGTLGGTRGLCKVRGIYFRNTRGDFSSMCTIALLIDVVAGAP